MQEKFKTSIFIKLDFEKKGLEHDPIWIAKNPQILEKSTHQKLLELPNDLTDRIKELGEELDIDTAMRKKLN